MRLLDCTLRDGANVVGNGFSAQLTESMIRGLLACGIRDIELGNAKGLGAYEQAGARAPLTDLEYMALAEGYAGQGRLGMFLLAKCAREDKIQAAASHGLAFLRVGGNAGDGRASLEAVQMVKRAGLTCRYSLMKAYVSAPEELAEEARMLEDAGADAITIMDSAGTLLPEEVSHYVSAMKRKLSIPIGFHGHSNLGLSQANALMAVQAGAEEVDCGLLGMARSAGNCATELAAAVFLREGLLKEVNLYQLLDYLDGELIPAMAAYDYRPAVRPVDLILGLSGCHSSYLETFRTIAKETGVSPYRLIMEVSAVDKKAPDLELMRATAKKMQNS